MKFSAMHASSGLTATIRSPQTGQVLNVTFPRGVFELPINGQVGDRNFEGKLELVERPVKPGDDMDLVILFTAPALRLTGSKALDTPRSDKHTGAHADPASRAPAERGRSGIAPPTVALSPGNEDMEMAAVATQDFDAPGPKRAPVTEGVFGVNPFSPPAAFVTAQEGYKGLELGGMQRPDETDGTVKTATQASAVAVGGAPAATVSADDDTTLPPHMQAALDDELPPPGGKAPGGAAGGKKEEKKKASR